jgi:exonuclease SbcC
VRLHALRVAGFGPFPQPVDVDFDAVCAAGLFLIHGATGAGKTSLLDAVCFAIFADVPGARTRRGLVSDHAPEGTRPVVTLEFTSGGRRFRIERSPDHVRPKRRGSGTTRVPASVVLEEWVAGSWRAVSTRHDEVAHLLDQLLGMGLTQFAKVVVLPQGDVSAFLRASPEDRRDLLERLFDISTYTDVETWLVEERRRTADVAAGLEAAVDREIDRLDDYLPGTPEHPWRDLPPVLVPRVLEEHLGRLEREVGDLLAAADAAGAALAAAGRATHEARTRAAARDRGQHARERRVAELARASRIEELRAGVARALAADGLAGHLDALERTLLDEEARRAELDLLAARLDLTPEAAQGDDPGRLAATIRAGDAVVSEISHLATELVRAEQSVGAARAAASSALHALEAATLEEERAADAVDAAQRRLDEVTATAATHERLDREHTDLVERIALHDEIEDLRLAREEAAASLVIVREHLLAAQQTLLDLRQARLDGLAAELAAALSPGHPCAVCGSTNHPAPATATTSVRPEDVDTAEELLETLRAEVAAQEQGVAALLAREETLGGRLGDGPVTEREELVRCKDETAAALERARRAVAESGPLITRLDAARATASAASRRAAECATSAAAARAGLESAMSAREDLVARLAARRAHHSGCPCLPSDQAEQAAETPVDDVVRTHTSAVAMIARLLTCRAALGEARTRREEREEVALRVAAERGFADLETVRAARRDPARLESDRAAISDHEQALAVTDAVLSEPSVIAALEADPPDLEALALAETQAGRAVRDTQAAHTAAETRLGVLRSVHTPLRDLVVQLESARARAAQVKEVADAVSGTGGGNLLRMRLSSYVLAARLEKVVALANERLVRMDAGRYLLEHSDERVSGTGRSGLDLRVLDQWTGRTRSTSSLSGGESFMVSLALALGLADAVREESGGVDLGTLFVDEGFGSLDDESLEQVMGVLDGLREGGRAVGVVSHVGDLRSRISHQVVVTKSATGSAVEVRTTA